MKTITEIALIWGITLAVILAVFLLNIWLVYHIGLLIGSNAIWWVIGASVTMATMWIFSFGGGKK